MLINGLDFIVLAYAGSCSCFSTAYFRRYYPEHEDSDPRRIGYNYCFDCLLTSDVIPF